MSTFAATTLQGAPEPAPEPLLSADPNPASWVPVVEPLAGVGAPHALPQQVTRNVISGTSALGASVCVERGAGFLANIIAARLGGAQTFGAYSLAVTTANQISIYAAGQIGSTAARFSGKYPQGSAGYPTLMRALAIVSVVSAALAALGIWTGAGPIAHILGKDNLETLLRCAWISAAGAVLLECARGFFVGQRFIAALLSMSTVVGAGMIFLLPYAAHKHSPVAMIELQGAISVAAVVMCCVFGRQLGWRKPATSARREPTGRMLREVWSFGFVQLAGLVGANLAGWWSTALVARADTTLIQMSFFTIASQLRNLVSLPPSLLTEGSYAVMADPTHEAMKTPQRVMALCCFAALSVSVLLGALGMIIIPWGITLLYGRTYAPAGAAVAVGLATAVAHMGTAPAAARLTIVSIRITAVINTIWAVFVAVASTVFMLHGGNAWRALAIYFFAHVLSSILVLDALKRRDHLPEGLGGLFAFSAISVCILACMSLWRGFEGNAPAITALMGAVLALVAGGLYGFGKRYAWLPPRTFFAGLMATVGARLPWGGARV